MLASLAAPNKRNKDAFKLRRGKCLLPASEDHFTYGT